MIEAKGVTKRYNGSIVVDAIDLAIPEGRLTAVIGPNGAGKSTFLSMVGRLIGPDAGVIAVAGLDIAKTSNEALARRLSYLRQDNQVQMRLSVRDLVGFGRYPHSKGRLTAEDARHVDQALDYLGLAELGHRFIDELSGGQRQRAFVAMILAQDTDHLLLDEPLNNLDLKHAVAMMRLLRRMVDELGKTVVVVLHDINFASAYADHVIAMKNGAVAFDGPSNALMRAEILSAIYELPIGIAEIAGRRIAHFYD